MIKHEIIIPENSEEPFAITFDDYGRSWEPGYFPHDQRDYFITHEVASILLAKKIIRRDKDKGIQTARRWIREKKFEGAYLFKKSKKYGYLIPKDVFAKFYEEMTGGDTFYEERWALNHLITLDGEFYIEDRLEHFEEFEKKLGADLGDGKYIGREDEIKDKIKMYQTIRSEYRKKWYEVVLGASKAE